MCLSAPRFWILAYPIFSHLCLAYPRCGSSWCCLSVTLWFRCLSFPIAWLLMLYLHFLHLFHSPPCKKCFMIFIHWTTLTCSQPSFNLISLPYLSDSVYCTTFPFCAVHSHTLATLVPVSFVHWSPSDPWLSASFPHFSSYVRATEWFWCVSHSSFTINVCFHSICIPSFC